MPNRAVTSMLLVLASGSLPACALASGEDSLGDDAEDAPAAERATRMEQGALSVREDTPAPPGQRQPSLPRRRELWDLKPFLEELRRGATGEGRCVVQMYEIYDPVRDVTIKVPVTVCR